MTHEKTAEKLNEKRAEKTEPKKGEKSLAIRTGIRGGLAVTLMID